MKVIVGVFIGLVIAAQAPMAWQAYEKVQQCEGSVAKQASAEVGKLMADLDVVDCSFGKYYKQALAEVIGG